jgi:CubicO group peptidase (beta-lactamase class C family)
MAALADDVDDYVRAQMQSQHVPGLSLAVVRHGAIVKATGYGLANVETNTPATADTVYQIGALGKQFIAAAILQLTEEGKLHLDDKVGGYVPGVPETWNDITIRRLLTNTSGLMADELNFGPYVDRSNYDSIATLFPIPLRFVPGDEWKYGNADYNLLAEIIYRVTRKPWRDSISAKILSPLHMNDTRVNEPGRVVLHRASGYAINAGDPGLENAPISLASRPCEAILSNVMDLARWDAALCSDSVLASSSRAMMWTPCRLTDGTDAPYGFAWFVDATSGHRRIHHDGRLAGFSADMERFADDELTIIVLTNLGEGDPVQIAQHVAGFYVHALRPTPESQAIDVEDPQVAQDM